MNRQKLVLAALLAILGLALWYAYWASPRQERVTPVAGSPATSQRAREVPPALAMTDKRRVRLEILERGVDAFSEPRRDIFRLAQPRPIAATPVVTAPPPAPTLVLPPVPVVPPTSLQADIARFHVLGSLQKENRKTVFLSLGNEIFIVKGGDRFGKNNEFEVEEITDEKLIVRQGEGAFPITVPLIDKSPSLPTSSPPSAERFTTRVRPTSLQSPSIRIVPDEEDEEEDSAEDEDLEEVLDESAEEELPSEEENPTEETESGNPAAGDMGSLPLRSMIQ